MTNDNDDDADSQYFQEYTGADAQLIHTLRHRNKLVRLILHNGASATCLKEGITHAHSSSPMTITGACKSLCITGTTTQTTSVPCPELGGNSIITGVYHPDFRHNLIPLKELQQQGVTVTVPAYKNYAQCTNSHTEQFTMQFVQGTDGLYAAQVEFSTLEQPAAEVTHSTDLLH